MYKFAVSLATAATLSTPLTSIAETQTSPIVVTATRTAQSADDTLSSVSVITRETIEQSGSKDVADIIASQAGISLSRNGGPGSSTSLYIRGSESDHVLVLIDGVRAASATLGQFSWENLQPDQIERIEIVRGPRASLYGSDAIGGVIHIFTRNLERSFVRFGTGSHGTQDVNAGFRGGDDWRYSINAGSHSSNGTPTVATDTDDRAYNNNHASLRLSGPLSGTTRLNISTSQSQGDHENDPFTGDSDFTHRVSSIRLDHQQGDWEQSLLLGQNYDEYTSHSPFLPATITTDRNSVSWQHNLVNAWGMTSAGIDYWRDHAEKDNSGLIDETITQRGVFVEHQWSDDRNNIQLALRNDEHKVFDNYSTGNIALGRELDAQNRIFVSYGTAYKAPTVNDLYWPNSTDVFYGTTYITLGNPALEPEESSTVELGLIQRFDRTETRINLYRTWTKNLINWASTQTGPSEYTYQPANIGRVRIDGVEVTIKWPISEIQAELQLALLDAENLDTGNQLDRRPKSEALFSLTSARPNYNWRVDWELVGKRLDREGQVELAGYGVVNVAYNYHFDKNTSLGLKANNLFDQDYVLASSFSGDYAISGQTGYIDLTFKF